MTHEEEPFGIIDHFTSLVMNQVSRRGFLKGAGTIGLALLGTFFGIGRHIAKAAVICPPSTFGDCNNCFSACNFAASGDSFQCVCQNCNCSPSNVEAFCQWLLKPPSVCIKNGVCLEC